MKIMIWGTGAIAKQLLEENIYEVLQDAIVAFVDNDIKKVGGEFMGKKIISPTQIKDYNYDKICILNSYVEEIKQQAINELQVEEDKLVGIDDFDNIIVRVLIENYSIQTKRILIIGDEKVYLRRKNMYHDLLCVVGFVEAQNLRDVKKYQFDYVLLMNLMNILYLDKSKGRNALEKSFKQELKKTYGVTGIIFTEKIFQYIINGDKQVTWGVENPDKTFLVLRTFSGAGLGGFVQTVINGVHYAMRKGYIPIADMMTYPNQYLKKGEVGKVNAWEKFFEQPAGYTLSDIANSKNVIVAGNKSFWGGCSTLDFLKEKPMLVKKAEQFIEAVLWNEKKVLGVLMRGTDYINCRPYGHPVQPTMDIVLEKVQQTLKDRGTYDYIYICTEVQEYVEIFQKEFGEKVIFYPQRRLNVNYSEFLCEQKFDREDDEYYRGADYWIALKILSKCNALIAGNCGGTTIARKLNNDKYEYIYIFDLGIYGIDDIK